MAKQYVPVTTVEGCRVALRAHLLWWKSVVTGEWYEYDADADGDYSLWKYRLKLYSPSILVDTDE